LEGVPTAWVFFLGALGSAIAAGAVGQRKTAISVASIGRIQVATDMGRAVTHIFYESAFDKQTYICSFVLANVSDFGHFWAALTKQIPSDKLILPETRSPKTSFGDSYEKGDGMATCRYCGAQLSGEIDYCLKCGKSKS
jgi:hypothetical protein